MRKCATLVAALGFTAVPALALAPDAEIDPALGDRAILPGGPGIDALGDLIWGPIDIEGQTGETGALGVQFDGTGYHVTSRVLVAPTGNQVFITDAGGTIVNQYDQIAGAIGDAWGYRDGMSDGDSLYFGWGGGVAKHNLDGSGGVLQVAGGGPNGTWRALAYDPAGDGGNGSFYTGDFGDPILECRMDGSVIRSLPNLDGWSIYGLALDPCTGNLWAHTRAVDPEVWEIDTGDGRWTGVQFFTDVGTVQGGLTGVPGGAGGSGDFYDLVGLLQATPDSIAGYEVYVTPPDGCGGGLTLVLSGDCPGRTTVSGSGATPGGRVAVIRAFGEGNQVIPQNNPCAGTELGLNRTATLVTTVVADGNGDYVFGGNAPSAACGRTFVQTLDIETCATSNVEPLG